MIISNIHVSKVWKVQRAAFYPIKRFLMTVLLWHIVVRGKVKGAARIVREHYSYFIHPEEGYFGCSAFFNYDDFKCKGVFDLEAGKRIDLEDICDNMEATFYEQEYDATSILFHEYAGYLNPGDIMDATKKGQVTVKVRNKQHFDLVEEYYLNQDSISNCVKDILLYRKYLKWSAELFIEKLQRFK